jgi:hypothetical protein
MARTVAPENPFSKIANCKCFSVISRKGCFRRNLMKDRHADRTQRSRPLDATFFETSATHSRKGLLTILGATLLLALLPSCASLRPKGPKITLQCAVIQTVDAMKEAYDRSKSYGGTWGLSPSEVTIVYNVSDETEKNGKLTVGASYPPMTLGGELGLTQKAISGNTVTLKFTRAGQ